MTQNPIRPTHEYLPQADTTALRKRVLTMRWPALLLFAFAVLAGIFVILMTVSRYAYGATAPRSAKEVRGATPYMEIKNEPPPKLIVDPVLPDLLAQGVVWIQWRVENVNIVPVFSKGALNVSPRVGHFHIHMDDLPWFWADASNINTIDLAGVPPGPHKITIELVDATHVPFPGQSKTVTFTVPKEAASSHSH